MSKSIASEPNVLGHFIGEVQNDPVGRAEDFLDSNGAKILGEDTKY